MYKSQWAENVILVDAEYLSRVAFDLTVNFERIINRRIPPADLCHWLDCVALDGGLRPGNNAIQVAFLHDQDQPELKNFTPARFADELDGQAFKDNIGEFSLASFPIEEEVVGKTDFLIQSLENVLASAETKRVMVIYDPDTCGSRARHAASTAGLTGKDITIFTMEPTAGRGYYQELLGYSLMSALGIKSDELKNG